MKSLVVVASVGVLFTSLIYATDRAMRYPPVKAVWLREPPVLGAFPAPGPVQEPDDAGHRLRKQDPQSYCWNPETSGSQVRRREQDPHAHRCACHLVCQIGSEQQVVGEHEDNTCAHWCVRDACECHVESPCEVPGP